MQYTLHTENYEYPQIVFKLKDAGITCCIETRGKISRKSMHIIVKGQEGEFLLPLKESQEKKEVGRRGEGRVKGVFSSKDKLNIFIQHFTVFQNG